MRSQPRRSKIPTVQNLENVALFYLSRFASSESSLRRVLENRMRRAAMRNPAFAADDALQNKLRAAIDGIVEKHKKTGALNDNAYAEMKITSLRRAGRSARAIRQKLGQKGIAKSLIENNLERETESDGDSELLAARELARRRRLGPFRKGEGDALLWRKELAVMARAGFSLDVARRILGKSADDADFDEGMR